MEKPLSLLELVPVLLNPPAPTLLSAQLYLGFLVWIGVMSHILPGTWVKGQLVQDVPGGRRVDYKLNGFVMALITYAFWFGGSYLGLFKTTIIYDNFGPLCSFVLLFCVFASLFLVARAVVLGKGKLSGNYLADFWLGIELNPRMFGLELKFVALRPAMIGWTLICFSFAAKQYELLGYITTRMWLYQIFAFTYSIDYLFFEEAMLSTFDIISEKWAFMLLWGDLWWMNFAFSVQPHYLLMNEKPYPPLSAAILLVFFIVAYVLFRVANLQKNNFKKDPTAPIFATGKKPETIRGRILVSGLWGVMRKPNYIGDWMIALSLSLTCGYDHIFAYLYPIYLISLDIHRWTRDEAKCSEKYGKDWELYRNRVKWVFCPYIY